MIISQLIKRVKTVSDYSDREVTFVTDKIEKVEKDSVFVCIKGKNADGHKFAKEALEKGAGFVVTQKDLGLKEQIIVENTREAYTLMCSAFYGDPANELKIIGVTGTNGKTSTAFLLREILEKSGHKTGLIGTVCDIVDDKQYPGDMTTPDADVIFRLMREMVNNDCEYCVMETSSQGLYQKRLAGIRFDIGIFTNLTEDHLDYHLNMQSYKDAKKILFENSSVAIINLDDENGLYMSEGLDLKTVTYSIKNDKADYVAKNIQLFDDSVRYEFVGTGIIGRIRLNVPGKFSVYNSMAAAAAATELGIDMKSITSAFESSLGVKGRMETLQTGKDFTVIIDYAHTPDGLENLLSSIRGVYKGRIITVFGCGGDRDKAKRPIMGKIAGDLSDVAVVTSDNPRNEDPEEIIKDILAGMSDAKAEVISIADRTLAIEKALDKAKKGDVVVLAGKGHETYQVLKQGRIHYDEREIIKRILDKK